MHLRPAVPASTGALLAGETTGIAMTAMVLRTCSTVKMMLGPMVTQVRGRDPPATRTHSLGLRTEQDLKVPAIDEDAAFRRPVPTLILYR